MAAEEIAITSEKLTQLKQEAENGSEESQVFLAKYFLQLADSGIDTEENKTQALDWLIQASKQGSEDATDVLKKYVDRGIEIDENRSQEIKWCLTTSSAEKHIRQAARNLFHRLNTSHKNVISREEYLGAVKSVTDKVQEQKLLMAAGKKIGDNITENDFVKMLSKKIQGKITLTSDELAETNISYESAGYTTRILKYPKQTVSVIIDQALEFSSKEGMNWVISLIPTNQLYLLGLLFIYSFLTPAFLLFLVPLCIFYLSFTALVMSTLQMFYKKKKRSDATTLASILKEYDVTIDLDKTESQYTWNSMMPYLVFFGNLLVAIASFAVANKSYIPCAEVCIVSLVMTGFCFFGLSDHHDKLTIFAMMSNFLASLPVFLHVPNVPVLKQAVGLLTQPFFAFDMGFGVKLNISFPSVAYAIIPLFFLRMAMQKSWQGTYRVLIPHLVCYFWWNFVTSTFPFTSWLGLIRATFGYLLLPIILPVSFVGFLGVAGFGIYKAFQSAMIGKVIITVCLLAVPAVLSQTKSLFGKNFNAKIGIPKKVLMIVFSLLAIVPLIFVQLPSFETKHAVPLTWNSYSKLCIPGSDHSVAATQMKCSYLTGMKVMWMGTLQTVAVAKTENTAESVFKSLPSFLTKPLKCIFGVRFEDCQKILNEQNRELCEIIRTRGEDCHVKNHDEYQFELSINIDDVTIKLSAGHDFNSTILALNHGEEVKFNATLAGNVGTSSPKLKLTSITSLNRLDMVTMTVLEDDQDLYMNVMQEAISVTFNFIWFPVFEYSIK
ncbi:wolframin-like [Gigantopelta aegis]|uniref:wolframin-like n=1 Tax=Gigantopelta aegis TaxID=1735272 RepID=UPI001B88D489|nr:wolframin-like [Gigantopelta aegis]